MYHKYIKRFFDIMLSLCCIIVSSPILLVTALLVRIKLGSPVIFKQERPGYHNEIFTLYKFRSMTDAVDENGDLLPDKERLPRFGQMLRSTSLDELPEFFNILFGHMSFVGDGINDSAVLEAANVGISMGKMGSDAAITSSDVVIMDDDIRKIPMAIRASRRILKNVKFIVALSLLTKICVLTAIYLGVKNGIYLAVLADVGLSLVCVMIALLNNKCVK